VRTSSGEGQQDLALDLKHLFKKAGTEGMVKEEDPDSPSEKAEEEDEEEEREEEADAKVAEEEEESGQKTTSESNLTILNPNELNAFSIRSTVT
jgi:hypothetical protein